MTSATIPLNAVSDRFSNGYNYPKAFLDFLGKSINRRNTTNSLRRSVGNSTTMSLISQPIFVTDAGIVRISPYQQLIDFFGLMSDMTQEELESYLNGRASLSIKTGINIFDFL